MTADTVVVIAVLATGVCVGGFALAFTLVILGALRSSHLDQPDPETPTRPDLGDRTRP